jgi:hypothetical protein
MLNRFLPRTDGACALFALAFTAARFLIALATAAN